MTIEAEKALLGSVLINPGCMTGLDIEVSDFTSEMHREIWQAMNSVIDQKLDLDYLTIVNELERKGSKEARPYLSGLTLSTPSSMHAETYAMEVKDSARRKQMIEIAQRIVKTAMDRESDSSSSIPGFVESLVNTASVKNGAQPLGAVLGQLYDEVSSRYTNPVETWGIPSGFDTFDRLTGGLQKSELLIMSGIPGVGKSLLTMQMAAQMGAHSPGVIYSLEMSKLSVVRRLVSGEAQIETRLLKTGKINPLQWQAFGDAIGHFEKLPVLISDASGWTTTSLRADLARLKMIHNVQWFVVDYLYLLNDGQGLGEIERTTMISKGLKRTAMELNIAGIAVHSLNKIGMAEQGTPAQENLRGSGQVVYDADVICFLTNYAKQIDKDFIPQEQWENMRLLQFGKGRELADSRKYIKLVKRPGFPSFAEYAR
jgi:replicative DNA helicase